MLNPQDPQQPYPQQPGQGGQPVPGQNGQPPQYGQQPYSQQAGQQAGGYFATGQPGLDNQPGYAGQPQGQMGTDQRAPQYFPPIPPEGKRAKAKKPLLKRWWVWAIIIVVLMMIISNLAGGGDDPAETAATSTSSDSSTAAKDEATSADKTEKKADEAKKPEEAKKPAEKDEAAYGLGDAVAADGWEITVSKVKDGVSTVGNEFLNTKAQGQFVKVNLSVKNTKSEPKLFFEDNIKLSDKEGNTYSSDSEAGIYADEDSILFLEEINPGNTAKGVLIFDVPEDVTPERLVFEGGIFSDPVEISLK